MSSRFFFLVVTVTALGFVLLGECVLYAVDPVAIWNAQIVKGINNVKLKQDNFSDVYVPYDYRRYKPDVVYVGTSKVQTGFVPDANENGYNMGMPGISLPKIRRYLQFAYAVHRPHTVYLGLDFIFFSRDNFFELNRQARPSFSEQRLDAVSMSRATAFFSALKDSMGFLQYVPDTLRTSADNKDADVLYERGWHKSAGSMPSVIKEAYYATFNVTTQKTKFFKNFSYADESMECLADILQDAINAGVEVVVFFNPMNVDEHTLMYLGGHESCWNDIKVKVANLCRVYDFDFVNERTKDVKHNYLDFLHYRASYGNEIKAVLYSRQTNDLARLLTKENAQSVVEAETAEYKKWRLDNSERVETLRFFSETEQTAEPQSLAKFIGF